MESAKEHVYQVGELNRAAGSLLEQNFAAIQVCGELHEIRRPGSGHWYFTLKDEAHELRCVMFRKENAAVTHPLQQGDQLMLTGKLTIYKARGQYQLIAERLELAGEGLLLKRFEELRRQLAAEGLFDEKRKQPLPDCPHHLAVVTSQSGAAVRDVLAVAARRAPLLAVSIVPTAVQGDMAPAGICRALDLCELWNQSGGVQPFDAVLVCRGGGSLEDLWAFNEEAVVRRIAGLKIPCISGVGHETDVTLSDFAADLRAATPSAAAEILTEQQSQRPNMLVQRAEQLQKITRQLLLDSHNQLRQLARRLLSPGRQLEQWQQRTDELNERLSQAMERNLTDYGHQLERTARPLIGLRRTLLAENQRQLTATKDALLQTARRLTAPLQLHLKQLQASLKAMNPMAVLERGYAIVQDEQGRIHRDTGDLSVGQTLNTRLARGSLQVAVQSIEKPQSR